MTVTGEHEQIIADLNRRGWAISDRAVPAAWWTDLLAQARKAWQGGMFEAGEIGQQAGKGTQPQVRGDWICWLDPVTAQGGHPFMDWMAQLRQLLNQHFNMGLRSQEFHFARYAPGAGYRKHIDQHRGVNHRKISIVLYLNPDWDQGAGGELCFYDPRDIDTEIQRVSPVGGRLAVFASWLMPHAVQPCRQERWSLTGWLRNDAPAQLTGQASESGHGD